MIIEGTIFVVQDDDSPRQWHAYDRKLDFHARYGFE